MPTNKPSRHSGACRADSCNLLPGCSAAVKPPCEGGVSAGALPSGSSASQLTCRKSGIPMGSRPSQLHGNKAVSSGVGPGNYRTVRSQAGLINNGKANGGAQRPPMERAAAEQLRIRRNEDPGGRGRAQRGAGHPGELRPQGWLRKQPGEDSTAALASPSSIKRSITSRCRPGLGRLCDESTNPALCYSKSNPTPYLIL